MAARDPQTGQFVSTEDMNSYDGLDIEVVSAILDSDATELTVGSGKIEPLFSWEPLGGLSRDEVAELVTLVAVVSLSLNSDVGTDDPAHMTADWELSFDSTATTLRLAAGQPDVTEADVGGITGVDSRSTRVVDFDVLDFGMASAANPYNNATDGTGGGADSTHLAYSKPFRSWYGGGPVVDRHDELFVHVGFLRELTSAGIDFKLAMKYHLAWDVFEV